MKISDFCYVSDYVANGSFESLRNNVEYLDDGYAVLVRLTDFTKKWNSSYRYVSESAYFFLKHSKLCPGDLVMANVGEPGIVFIVPDLGMPMTLGPNSILIRPDEKIATSKYLYWYFKSQSGINKISSITSATAQKKFNKTSFRSLEIELPILTEQKRIAAILDKAAEIKVKREQTIAKLNELAQSIFMEMFGDLHNKVTLKSVCELITDGTHYTPTYADSGYVFLSAKNVTSGKIDWVNVKYVGEELHDELQKRVSPKLGDVLLAKNGTTGVAAIVDMDSVFDIYVSLALLRPSKNILTTYLHAALNSIDVKRQFNSALKGVGVPNLHLVDIRNALIPLPSIDEQKAFEEKLKKLKAVRSNIETQLQDIVSTIASLQHHGFTIGFTHE